MHNALLRSTAVLGLASLALAAQAAPITFTFTGTGTGLLNGVNFTNAALTFTAVGDTLTATTTNGGQPIAPVTATVAVAGIGNDTLLPAFTVFSLPNIGSVGLQQVQGVDVFGVFSSGLTGYDLTTATGPISGNAFGNPGASSDPTSTGSSFLTTRGTFRLDRIGEPGTFTASLQAVPEPATLAALSLGAAALLRRRRKA